MQKPCKAAKKILNLRSRFETALADTPLKNGCCTLVLGNYQLTMKNYQLNLYTIHIDIPNS